MRTRNKYHGMFERNRNTENLEILTNSHKAVVWGRGASEFIFYPFIICALGFETQF